MPRAHISEIVKVHAPTRRVTGSADIPLNAKGVEQAHEMAAKTKGATRVYSSPMKRAMETAKLAHPGAQPDSSLAPWALGQHEGKPSEQERPAINLRIRSRPDSPTGVSPFSGKKGESFNQARLRILRGVRHKLRTIKPGEKVIDFTHGRNIRLTAAWIKNGAPDDLTIDKSAMLDDGLSVKTGELFHITLKPPKMVEVPKADKPGYYQARHGATDWNQEESKQGAGS